MRERWPSPRRRASRSRSIAQSSPMSPSVRIAAAAIIGSGSASTGLINLGTAGWWASSRRCKARTRRHLPTRVRGRPPARRTRRRARRSLRGFECPRTSAVETEAPDDDRERQRDPRRERDREHGREQRGERARPLTGRRRTRRPSRPSNGGSRAISEAATGRECGRFRDLRADGTPRWRIPSLRTIGRMRMRGLEPPRPYGHTDLNRARLPIPPHPRGRTILALGRLTPR